MSPPSTGGTNPIDVPVSGQGGASEESGGASDGSESDSGGTNGGTAPNAGTSGTTSASGTAGASGGVAGNSGGRSAGGAGSGGGGAGAGGTTSAGTGGTVAGAGVGGKLEARACAELRSDVEALLAEAQLCKPSNRAACADVLRDECGCSVVVDDRESTVSERYVAAVEQLRARCSVACLAVTCREISNGECSSEGRGEARCVAPALIGNPRL